VEGGVAVDGDAEHVGADVCEADRGAVTRVAHLGGPSAGAYLRLPVRASTVWTADSLRSGRAIDRICGLAASVLRSIRA
jgi:hypothetical protein